MLTVEASPATMQTDCAPIMANMIRFVFFAAGRPGVDGGRAGKLDDDGACGLG
jgi:hypothetical protein